MENSKLDKNTKIRPKTTTENSKHDENKDLKPQWKIQSMTKTQQ